MESVPSKDEKAPEVEQQILPSVSTVSSKEDSKKIGLPRPSLLIFEEAKSNMAPWNPIAMRVGESTLRNTSACQEDIAKFQCDQNLPTRECLERQPTEALSESCQKIMDPCQGWNVRKANDNRKNVVICMEACAPGRPVTSPARLAMSPLGLSIITCFDNL